MLQCSGFVYLITHFGMRNLFHLLLLSVLFVFRVESAVAVAPAVSSLSPADNAQSIATSTSELSITFDQAVQGSAGNITLYKSDGTQVEQIAGNDAQVTGSGTSTLTIALSSSLASSNTNFYVQIQSTAILNGIGEFYTGISDTTTWDFKTLVLRGGAGRRLRIERIRNAPPTYSDRIPPSLSEVGIFVPRVTEEPPPPVETEEVTPRMAPHLQNLANRNLEIHRRLARRFRPSPTRFLSSLHERTCTRVERRFSFRAKVLERVNERLRKNFGFECKF
jgi:methionine-rich copper-binding protein CopC